MNEMRPLFSERVRCYLQDIDLVCSASSIAEARLKIKKGLTLKYQREELAEARDRLLRNKQYSEASRLELEYLARHPDDAAIHRKAARTFGRLGDIASAITHQRRAVQLEPSNADARRVLAKLLAQLGNAAAVH
jgi:Flp pilus assembly protein TadD